MVTIPAAIKCTSSTNAWPVTLSPCSHISQSLRKFTFTLSVCPFMNRPLWALPMRITFVIRVQKSRHNGIATNDYAYFVLLAFFLLVPKYRCGVLGSLLSTLAKLFGNSGPMRSVLQLLRRLLRRPSDELVLLLFDVFLRRSDMYTPHSPHFVSSFVRNSHPSRTCSTCMWLRAHSMSWAEHCEPCPTTERVQR